MFHSWPVAAAQKNLKPRLHKIHVAGYKLYPLVSGYKLLVPDKPTCVRLYNVSVVVNASLGKFLTPRCRCPQAVDAYTGNTLVSAKTGS